MPFRNNSITIGLFLCFISIVACRQEYDYEAAALAELQTQERNDSLFFGIHFGMMRQAFFEQCAEMNQRRLFQQGLGKSVEYKVSEFSKPATMNFYPVFTEDRISEMPITFSYDDWAPWNKDSYSSELVREVADLFEDWYGKGRFHLLETHDGRKGLVRVDGNRRILLFLDGDQKVRAILSDLTVHPYHLAAIH